ncbi:MAG: thioredoxin [Clostridia bacterium]|nr:thioredoxin [Clostridia bacterium]
MAISVTKENYAEITATELPVLLDFWAPWCGPCRMLTPTIDAISETCDALVVGKVNVDEQVELAQQFGVMSIPTLVVLRGGEEVARSVGVRSKADILAMAGIEA